LFNKFVETFFNPVTPNPVEGLHKWKDGEIYQDPEDAQRYLAFFFGVILFFGAVFYFWAYFFEHVLKSKGYLAKSERDRLLYVSLWGANTHHAIVFSTAVYNFATH